MKLFTVQLLCSLTTSGSLHLQRYKMKMYTKVYIFLSQDIASVLFKSEQFAFTIRTLCHQNVTVQFKFISRSADKIPVKIIPVFIFDFLPDSMQESGTLCRKKTPRACSCRITYLPNTLLEMMAPWWLLPEAESLSLGGFIFLNLQAAVLTVDAVDQHSRWHILQFYLHLTSRFWVVCADMAAQYSVPDPGSPGKMFMNYQGLASYLSSGGKLDQLCPQSLFISTFSPNPSPSSFSRRQLLGH